MARIKAKNLDVEKKLGKKDLKKVRGGGSTKNPAMLIPLPSPHPVTKKSRVGLAPLPSPHPVPGDMKKIPTPTGIYLSPPDLV